jgi:hypothetical protein
MKLVWKCAEEQEKTIVCFSLTMKTRLGIDDAGLVKTESHMPQLTAKGLEADLDNPLMRTAQCSSAVSLPSR